jgi:hypothetical protein
MKRTTGLARLLTPSRRGPTWAQLGIAMGIVLSVAAVSPALGGPSLRSLVRSEVARQINTLETATAAKKKAKRGPRGPQGSPGAAGANGVNGSDGSARAYGLVTPQAITPCAPNCFLAQSKGISTVTRVATGDYCVHVPGIDGATVAAVADVSWGDTAGPEGNGSALTDRNCDVTGFDVRTERINPATGSADAADNVAFTIVVP